MKLAAFDLEIAKEVEGEDWQLQRPLGISCAMALTNAPIASDPGGDPWLLTWKGEPQLTTYGARQIVEQLYWLVTNGFTIVTVNGLGFDFAILAEESGMVDECADIALNHHCELRWKSKKGRGWAVGLLYSGDTAEGYPIYRLPTVAEMLTWPRPDTSWMSDPMNPDELAAWKRLKQNGRCVSIGHSQHVPLPLPWTAPVPRRCKGGTYEIIKNRG